MQIVFCNDSDCVSCVTVDRAKTYVISPKQSVSVEVAETSIEVSVRRNIESYKVRLAANYVFVLETTYQFIDVVDNEVFRIMHDVSWPELFIAYDRFVVGADNAHCVKEANCVLGKQNVTHQFKREEIVNFISWFFIEGCGIQVLFWVIGLFIIYYFGWKITVLYLLTVYSLLFLLYWFVTTVGNVLINKMFRQKSDRKVFYYRINDNNILEYYADPNRKNYIRNVEDVIL